MSYYSAEHKKRFSWRFGILILVFITLQFLMPFLLILPSDIIDEIGRKKIELMNVLQYKNQYYSLYREVPRTNKYHRSVNKLYQLKDGKQISLSKVNLEKGLLLNSEANEEGIWFVYYNYYLVYNGTTVIKQPFNYELSIMRLGDGEDDLIPYATNFISTSSMDYFYLSYIYDDENYDKIIYLTSFKNGRQSLPVELPFINNDPDKGIYIEAQLLVWDSRIWRWAVIKNEIYYQTIEGNKYSEWTHPGSFPYKEFKVGHDKDGLFIAGLECRDADSDSKKSFDQFPYCRQNLVVARLVEGSLGSLQKYKIENNPVHIFIISSDSGNAVIFAERAGCGGSQLYKYEITGAKLGKAELFEKKSLFDSGRSYLIGATRFFIPLSLVFFLALIASIMIPHYRPVKTVLGDGREYEYASVFKRALSQMVDLLILIAPVLPFVLLAAQTLKNYPYYNPPLYIFPILIAAWLGLALLYFAILEGRYGWTPGKLALGIRVIGEEGMPPGIKRALIRNMLRCVDGFYNFYVGVALIAFTDNWQRVGDMVARTMVVKKTQK